MNINLKAGVQSFLYAPEFKGCNDPKTRIKRKENKEIKYIAPSQKTGILMSLSAIVVSMFALKGKRTFFFNRKKATDVAKKGASLLYQKGKKSFIDSSNSLLDNVTLKNGRAICKDGNGFSGFLKTVTNSGKKVAIKFKNGEMTSSTIDDKLYKTYSKIDLNKNNGTHSGLFKYSKEIKEYISKTGIKKYNDIYDEKGNLVRHIAYDTNGDMSAMDFIKGKIASFGRSSSDKGVYAEIYNQKGKITKTIKSEFTDNTGGFIVISKKGKSQTVKRGYTSFNASNPFYEFKIDNPTSVSEYKNGVKRSSIWQNKTNLGEIVYVNESNQGSVLTSKNNKTGNSIFSFASEIRGIKRKVVMDKNGTVTICGIKDSESKQNIVQTLINRLETTIKMAKENDFQYSYEGLDTFLNELKANLSKLENKS